MARKTLRDVEATINTQSRDLLGQPASYYYHNGGALFLPIFGAPEDRQTLSLDFINQAYQLDGGGWTFPLLIQGDFSDGILSGEISSAVQQEIEIMIVKADRPAKPSGNDRITIDRLGATVFYPTNVQSDDTGLHWLMNIMEA
jgi:hypothetical protein